METMNTYNGTILVVDLDAQTCTTEELSTDLIEQGLGGAGINLLLYEQYKDRNPLVLGSGLLTATFAPAACCGVMTAKSPVTGQIAHVPFGWQTGVEMKLTGFDFVVILGTSPKPVRLWLHDGLSDINDAADIWGKDVWASVDKIREAYGDEMVQTLIIGPAGENKQSLAQVCENYWGSKDKAGLGAVFGAKNLKAVAMRGLGSLEVAEGFFQKCMELKNEIVGGSIKGKAGLYDIGAALGIDATALEKMKTMIHRNNAAYNCPYPYYTFLKYNEPPAAMDMKGHAEPGCLVSDIAGFAALAATGSDPARAFERCCRFGLEPLGTAAALKKQGAGDVAQIDKLAGTGTAEGIPVWPVCVDQQQAIMAITKALSFAVPPRAPFSQDGGAQTWVARQAVAYLLGIDPVIMLLAPELTEEKLAALVALAADWDDFSADTLKKIANAVITKST
ncbi:MAG: hypothetical protein N3B18_00800 [Desulfobacterota bacterium]|nr:hypothetical protein [Thermodesulfobacteriota bacterium]